ncbi:hypothetical protein KJ855_03875 [Patescibacteria group bacterium]|nr:hypothetical protein [Patescibacteria group bacterium]
MRKSVDGLNKVRNEGDCDLESMVRDPEKFRGMSDVEKYEYIMTNDKSKQQWQNVLLDYHLKDNGEKVFFQVLRDYSTRVDELMKAMPLVVAFVRNKFPYMVDGGNILNESLKISDDMCRAISNIRLRSNGMEPREYDEMLRSGYYRADVCPESSDYSAYRVSSLYFFTNLAEHLDHKRFAALNMWNQGMIDHEVMKKYPCIYTGSGEDIEFPLALGARKIVMLDFDFANDPRLRENVFKNITRVTDKMPEVREDCMSFEFDFGKGKEKVEVRLESKKYGNIPFEGNREPEYDKSFVRAEQYELPDKIGMVLGALSMCHVYNDERVWDNLVDGGVAIEMPVYEKVNLNQVGYTQEYYDYLDGARVMVLKKKKVNCNL